MFDVYREIPPLVADIADLSDDFPDRVARLPCCVLVPVDQPSGIILHGEERFTRVQFQIDVYHTDLKCCTDTAAEIRQRLISRGFSCGSMNTINEKGLKRKVLTFSSTIDEVTKQAYRGGAI